MTALPATRPLVEGGAAPGQLPDPTELSGIVGAWHRAMPFTRLVDCGTDAADARELLNRTATGSDWGETALEIGERRLAAARKTAADGHIETARQNTGYAAAAFNFAQMARNLDSDDKRAEYGRHVDAVRMLASLSDGTLREVSVPYGDGSLTGWLALPAGTRPTGTVIVWGGLSGWGASYLTTAAAYTRRGLACLLAEGPGQGQSRLVHGIHLRPDTLAGFGRFVDLVAANPELGGGIGLQGNSFGGLFAAHLASSDPRVGAVVVNGAPADPQLPEFRSAREQIFALLGAEDPALVKEMLGGLRFAPDRQPLAAPCLVLQGGADPLAGPSDQAPFTKAAAHVDSATLLWRDGQHTMYNHASERDSLLGDWFTDQLHAH